MKSYRLLILFLTLYISVAAQVFQPSYINYTANEGLSSNTIYFTMQDSSGFIWFAGNKGVVRYNGYEFKLFTITDGLTDNTVFDIYEDSQHRIWFACNNGSLCYYYKEQFYNKSNDSTLKKIKVSGPGLKVIEDFNHNVFYLTHLNLIRIDTNNNVSEPFKDSAFVYSTLALNAQKQVHVLTSKSIINASSGNRISLNQEGQRFPQLNSKGFISDSNFYYTQKNALVQIDIEYANAPIKRFAVVPKNTLVQCVYYDSVQRLMLIGTQNGLIYWDCDKNEILGEAFQNISISSFMRDNEGNLWMTSLNKGVFLCVNTNVHLLNKTFGLGFDKCLYLNSFEDSAIWVGSSDFYYSIVKGNKIIINQLPKQMGEGIITHIRQSPDKNYFITLGASLIQLDHHFRFQKRLELSARDILFLNNTSTLVASGRNILSIKLTDLNNEFLQSFYLDSIKQKKSIVSSTKSNGFYKGRDAEIYTFGVFGAQQLENEKFKPLSNNELLNENINNIKQSDDGILWLSSDINGVIAKVKDSIYAITTTSGLSSNCVNGFSDFHNGQFWVATDKGLDKINYELKEGKLFFNVKNYNQSYGIPGTIVHDVLQKDEIIYAATEFGLVSFNQNEIDFKTNSNVKLNIESVLFNDSLVTSDAKAEMLYNHNNFKINYACISPASFAKIKYKYRLQGLSTEWEYTTSTSLEYPSLPSGHYVFQIIAINSKGINSETKEFKFSIVPAFWQTWWFILIIILLVISILFYLVKRRIMAIQKSHKIKEQLLLLEKEQLESQKKQALFEKELAELEQRALRLHMNPHFIFNSINSIQGFYAGDEIEKAQLYISTFSTLLRMILHFSKEKSISLAQEISLIENYLQLNMLRFENKFNFQISVDPKLNRDTTSVPPMLIQPFVENAIIHGIAPLNKMGNIVVRFVDDDKFIRCEIEDNGIGVKSSKEMKRNLPYNSTGISTTEDRIKLINGGEYTNVTVIDLSDDVVNSSIGTKICFSILKEEYWS